MKFELKRVRKYCEKSRNNLLTFANLLSFHDSVLEDTQSKTLTALNTKHLQLTLSRTTNFRIFQSERLRKRKF